MLFYMLDETNLALFQPPNMWISDIVPFVVKLCRMLVAGYLLSLWITFCHFVIGRGSGTPIVQFLML